MIGFDFGSQAGWNLFFLGGAVLVVVIYAILILLTRWLGKRFGASRTALLLVYLLVTVIIVGTASSIIWVPMLM